MSPRKGLLCIVELHIRTITCPGITLKLKDDLYISAFVFGRYKKTSHIPAVFPLTFDEKLVFEKIYTDVIDPGDLVERFEFDTVVVDLIQTTPPVGEILATYEENSRDFLFPDPKVTHGAHSSIREVLMKRTCGFMGIAPKLRFYTNCLISESLLNSGKNKKQDNLDWQQHSPQNGASQTRSPQKNTPSPERNKYCLATKSYEQPTIASLSRSPSPYTKRRMCELVQVRQRLAHLNLGPFEFRKESDRPPFVIRRIEALTPSPEVHFWSHTENLKEAWSETFYAPTLLGSYRPKNSKIIRAHRVKDFSGFSNNADVSYIADRQFHSTWHSAPPSLQKYSSTPVLNRSSLRDRFHSGWLTPINGEEIHKRVKNILRTHSARQKLTFDESCLSKEDSAKTRDSSKTLNSNQKDVFCIGTSNSSDLQSSSSIQQSVMVHLDNSEYWTRRTAEYKNKPHRAIFEDSLEKIYRNMYRKASGTISKNK
ncbi:spermatogenesis-associated protein 6 [Heteronotia binoei]|uniref:spermatogenesis-associated protein 6 n=1 Tax=Heteronotia binoei TaxID=13085 RepID=UPI0029309D5C|nr:spermatogenesis-associated protein 6 [Heteronotia binoei]